MFSPTLLCFLDACLQKTPASGAGRLHCPAVREGLSSQSSSGHRAPRVPCRILQGQADSHSCPSCGQPAKQASKQCLLHTRAALVTRRAAVCASQPSLLQPQAGLGEREGRAAEASPTPSPHLHPSAGALGTWEQAVLPSQRHSAAKAGWAAPRWVLNSRGAEARAFISQPVSQQRLLQSRRAAAAGEQRWTGQTCPRTPELTLWLQKQARRTEGNRLTAGHDHSQGGPGAGRARGRARGRRGEGALKEGRALGSGGEPSVGEVSGSNAQLGEEQQARG